jgi:hypothetical protein
MQREDLKDLSREQLEQLICEWAMKYYDLKEVKINLERECNELIDERNNLLKNSKAYNFAELQDQHQQDCIRYNDMRTAYLVTLDELARLREQFGVGR